MSADYLICKFSYLGNCGEYARLKKTGIYGYSELKSSVLDTLCFKNASENLSECDLIQSRSGQTLKEFDQVCAFHRFTYGKNWRPPKHCQHPEHGVENFQRKKRSGKFSKKPVTLRQASWEIYKEIQISSSNFPIGGVLCTYHRHLVEKQIANKKLDSERHEYTSDDSSDTNAPYIPPKSVFLTHEQKLAAKECLRNLMDTAAPEVSPIKFQITSPVNELTPNTIIAIKRKYKQAKKGFKKQFFESFAPTQGQELSTLISSSSEEEEEIPENLKDLRDAYYSCQDEKSRMLVLSVIPMQKYSKTTLSKVFGCTRQALYKAEKWSTSYGACGQPKENSRTKLKMDLKKAEHFVEYLFSSSAIQDVAYGTCNLKYDSGDKQIVPHAVLTAIRSHTIAAYLHFCEEIQYNPIHFTSLWKILEAIRPSQRHCLAGLDNTVAKGLEGFEELKIVTKKVLSDKKQRDTLKRLEESKRYIKMTYSTHCTLNNNCKSHCISHALSSPHDSSFTLPCTTPHDNACQQCSIFLETVNAIAENIRNMERSEQKDETQYDFEMATENVFAWIKHNIRSVQQNKAKIDAFSKLNDTTGLWIRDWAQKILPIRYREAQAEYFGKKGISLHVDVFFTKSDIHFQKSVYFTVLFRCEQDVVDTLSVADVVLKQFHEDFPSVINIYAKSDNSGCYTGNGYAETEYNLCKSNGIILVRHDYSEPQKGKDQADRESAVAKRYIQAYVNSGHDLVTAKDVKNGILYQGGGKRSKVAIIEVNKENASISTPKKISGISNYHSVQFTDKQMTFWLYFDIGAGKKLSYTLCEFTKGTVMIDGFSSSQQIQIKSNISSSNRKDRQYQCLHFCPEVECSAAFFHNQELEEHIASGQHETSNAKTSLDRVRKIYADKMKTSCGSSIVETQISNVSGHGIGNDKSSENIFFNEAGWALPIRKFGKFTAKQKNFVLQLFLKGEKTGIKITPEKVVKEIRERRDQNGKKIFLPIEYMTTQQIRSMLSRMASMKKKGKLAGVDQILDVEDIQGEDNNDQIEDRNEVSSILQEINALNQEES